MAHSFIELDKAVAHVIRLVNIGIFGLLFTDILLKFAAKKKCLLHALPLISQLSNILEKYVYVGSEQEVFDYTFLPTASFIN